MTVRHILRDGTEVADVTGRVIRLNEFEAAYAVIREIYRKEKKNEGIQGIRQEYDLSRVPVRGGADIRAAGGRESEAV